MSQQFPPPPPEPPQFGPPQDGVFAGARQVLPMLPGPRPVGSGKARKGTAGGKGLGVGGLILSVLASLGGVGSATFCAIVVSEVGQAVEQSAQDLEDASAGKGVAVETDDVEAAAEALPLGQSATATVADRLRITVTGHGTSSVDRDALRDRVEPFDGFVTVRTAQIRPAC